MPRFGIEHGLLVAALLAIVVGYLLLAAQRLSAGPLLLVLGYCILFPTYLWLAFRRHASEGGPEPRRPDRPTGDTRRGVGE
ncbi:MAG: hypothetical protein R6X25_11520 [Candidatus Krumholzibacteriia bacterium]